MWCRFFAAASRRSDRRGILAQAFVISIVLTEEVKLYFFILGLLRIPFADAVLCFPGRNWHHMTDALWYQQTGQLFAGFWHSWSAAAPYLWISLYHSTISLRRGGASTPPYAPKELVATQQSRARP